MPANGKSTCNTPDRGEFATAVDMERIAAFLRQAERAGSGIELLVHLTRYSECLNDLINLVQMDWYSGHDILASWEYDESHLVSGGKTHTHRKRFEMLRVPIMESPEVLIDARLVYPREGEYYRVATLEETELFLRGAVNHLYSNYTTILVLGTIIIDMDGDHAIQIIVDPNSHPDQWIAKTVLCDRAHYQVLVPIVRITESEHEIPWPENPHDTTTWNISPGERGHLTDLRYITIDENGNAIILNKPKQDTTNPS